MISPEYINLVRINSNPNNNNRKKCISSYIHNNTNNNNKEFISSLNNRELGRRRSRLAILIIFLIWIHLNRSQINHIQTRTTKNKMSFVYCIRFSNAKWIYLKNTSTSSCRQQEKKLCLDQPELHTASHVWEDI